MNNSAETAARETAQYFDELIRTQIGRMGELEKLSIKHFLETGTVNGSFRQRLVTMLILLDIKHKTELSKVLAGHAYATSWIKVTPETEIETYRDLQFFIDGEIKARLGYFGADSFYDPIDYRHIHRRDVAVFRYLDTTPPAE